MWNIKPHIRGDDMSAHVVIDGDLNLTLQMDGEPSNVIKVTEYTAPTYTGSTEVTPSAETQTLLTANKTVISNIVINPIPNNYGLITWDGNILTVS